MSNRDGPLVVRGHAYALLAQMRTKHYLQFLLVMVIGYADVLAQNGNGIEVSAGIVQQYALTYGGMYFHPLPLKQFYAVGGVQSITESHSRNGKIEFQRVFLGVQVGDFFFVLPKLSYNFYSTHSANYRIGRPFFAPGVEGGLMLHPSDRISFGVKLSYEAGPPDDRFEVARTTEFESTLLFIRISLSN